MSQNGDLEVGFGLDTSEAQPKLKKLSEDLGKFNSEVAELATRLQRHLDGVFKDVDRHADKHLRAYRSAMSAVSSGNRLAESKIQGFKNSGEVEAVLRNEMLRINTTMEQSIARMAEAHIRAAARVVKTSERAATASMSRLMRETERRIEVESNRELQAAMRSEQRFRDDRLIERNQPSQRAVRQNMLNSTSLVRDAQYGNPDTAQVFTQARIDATRRREAELRNVSLQQATLISKERRNQQLQDTMLDVERLAIMDRKSAAQRVADQIRYSSPNYAANQASNVQYRVDVQNRRAQNPAFQAGQSYRDRQYEADTIRQGQVGRNQAGMERTLERLSSNGGADIMAIQTRLLVGYQALATVFRGFQTLKQFVIDLDKEFYQFQAITSTTNAEMVLMKERLIDVSEATKFTALEVAQAATVMGQAGLSAREVGDSIESVTLLATAAGTDLKSAVDLVTSTMSIFNLQTSQTGDIANTMTAAINGSKLTIDKLALGFQYAGNIAAQTGTTYQELTGIFGALANSGIRSGSTLGTGLRQLLIDLETPTKKFTAALESVGLSQTDVDVRSRGLIPVLKSLKEAGFGAGEAFESFEVRAAATFTALTNNIDTAVMLQKQFILSSAAAEANTTQMESFANTADKLKSVIGTLTYNAFEPFLRMLQDITNGIANTLSMLNKVPGALQAITAIAVGFGAAGTFALFGALFKGIGKGLPVLSTFTGLMTGMIDPMNDFTRSTDAAGKAVGRQHNALQAMFLTLRAHPYIAIASALVMAGTALYTFTSAHSDLKKQIDDLRGGIDQSMGLADEAREEAEAIEQVISNLIDRKEELDRDPLLREAKILEVMQQFKELGFEIDASTSSITQLIEALNKIKEVDLGDQIRNLGQMVEGSRLLLEALKLQQQEQASYKNSNNKDIMRAIGPILNTPKNFFKSEDVQQNHIERALRMSIPDVSAGTVSLARMGYGAETPEFATMQAMVNQLDNEKRQLENNIQSLKMKTTRTKVEEQLLETQERELKIYTAILARSQEILANKASQVSVETNIEVQKKQQEDKEAELFLSGAGVPQSGQMLVERARSMIKDAEKKLSDPKLNSETAAKVGDTLQAGIEELVGELEEMADTAVVKLMQEGFSLEDARAAVERAINTPDIASVQNQARAIAKGEADALAEIRADLNEKRQRVVAKQLSAQASKIGNTYSRAELSNYEKVIRGLFQEKRDLIEAVYKDKTGPNATRVELEKAEAARTDALDILKEEEAGYIDKIVERRLKITEIVYGQLDDALEAEIEVVKDKMKTLAERIAKTRPGAILDGLIEEYNNLVEQMHTMQTSREMDIYSPEYNPQNGETNGNIVNSLISTESSGRWDALGPVTRSGERAAGRLQFMPSRLAEYSRTTGSGPINQEVFRQSPALQQRVENWHFKEIQNFIRSNKLVERYGKQTFKNGMTSIDEGSMLAIAHLGGKGSARKKTGLMGYLMSAGASDPDDGSTKLSDYHRKHAGNSTDIDAFYLGKNKPSTADTDAEAAREELKEAEDKAILSNTKTTGKAFVRSSNASINGLMAQANTATSKDAVLDMARSANEIWAQIIAREVEVFEAENKQALAEGNPEAQDELQALKDRLGAERATEVGRFLEEYDRAALEAVEKPLKDAQMMLEEAKKPGNAGKYSADQIQSLQNIVYNQEQAVLATRVAAAEEKLRIVREQLEAATARSGEKSSETIQWLQAEAQAERELAAAKDARGIADSAANNTPQPLTGAVSSWKQSTGFFDEQGDLLSEAAQVENAWGTVLGTLSSGFEQLFMNIASGTMSAKDAMKQFALSVIQSFIGMIAKALAYMAVMQMIKSLEASGGGGAFTTALSAIMGIPGAANGELISTGIPNRDSTLRNVMPGEAILRKSAVDAIGSDKIISLNNMGNRRLSQSAPEMMGQEGGAGMVNVYVVSKDAVPPLGPNDIVAYIADNIERKGPIRQLIKQVQIGNG